MKRKLTFLLSAVIMFIMIMSGPMSIESKAARVLPFLC